jgi:ERF superfamily protein
MKTMLKQGSQSRLEARDGILCIVVETAFDDAASKAGSPVMRQWFRVEEPEADSAMVAGRSVRNIDPQKGLFVDEEGNSYRLAAGSQAKPDFAEVIPVNEGRQGTQLEAGAAPMPSKQRGGNGLPVTGRRRRKGGESHGAIADQPFSEQPNGQELNLREKFAEVRRRLGYVQKRGHNERHNYNYVTAADLAGAVGDILAELGVVVIPQLQSISTEPPRSSSERIARIVMNYRFVDARSGEELTVRVAGEGADAGDKAPYKAMTGALKYALLQSFLLATGDDPEDERADSRAALGSERVITPDQVRELQGLIEEIGTELERVLAYYRVSALSEMTEGSYRRALELLNRKLAKQSSQENGAHAQN